MGCGIIYPQRKLNDGSNYILTRQNFNYINLDSRFHFVNSSLNLTAITENKAAQYLMACDKPALLKYMPGTMIVTAKPDPSLADQIIATLGERRHYVIKPVDQTQGNGVRIVHRDKLDETLSSIFKLRAQNKRSKPGQDFWLSDFNPVFMVQTLETSKPVMKEGKLYDGTLRVFASLYRSAPHEDFKICVHDGYWKLPGNPVSSKIKNGNVISFSPYRLENVSVFNTIAGFFRKPVINAYPMNYKERSHVFPQIEDMLPAYLKTILRLPLGIRIGQWLTSSSDTAQSTAAMMAMHPIYYPSDAFEDLHLNSKRFPASYARIMRGLAESQYPDGPLDHYFNILSRRIGYTSEAAEFYVLEPYQAWRREQNLRLIPVLQTA